MCGPRVRRTFVAFALAAALLITAAPARASGLRLQGVPRVQDLWSHAWSWLVELMTGDDPAASGAARATYNKDDSGPPPNPPPPPGHSRGPNGGGHGDTGGGLDPDG